MSRRLRRFFTPDSLQKAGDIVRLTLSDTDHLRRIMRLKAGDACLVTNGEGVEAEAVVSGDSSAEATLIIQKILPRSQASSQGLSVFVYPAFIQRGKMDELVRRMQELSIQGFFSVETERTIVKMQPDAKKKVVKRWEKIIQEAAKQSGSLEMMECEGPEPLKEILNKIPATDQLIVFHPDVPSIPFGDWVSQVKSQKPVHLFFGPEGGFSDKEVTLLESKGATRVSLGPVLLKADTAVMGTVAALKFLQVQ